LNNTKHILVDGWNVIHANKSLKKILANDSQESAIATLSNMLAPIHDDLAYRLTIVFDGKGEEIAIERRSKLLTYSEIYTPSEMSADEFIEQFCAKNNQAKENKKKKKTEIIVASDDNLLSLTATTFGASSISAEDLFSMAQDSSKNITRKSHEVKASALKNWKKTNPFNDLKI